MCLIFLPQLLMNQNKDIKGMIRSLSTKKTAHTHGGGLGMRKTGTVDVEGTNNKSANGRGGHSNYNGKSQEKTTAATAAKTSFFVISFTSTKCSW